MVAVVRLERPQDSNVRVELLADEVEIHVDDVAQAVYRRHCLFGNRPAAVDCVGDYSGRRRAVRAVQAEPELPEVFGPVVQDPGAARCARADHGEG